MVGEDFELTIASAKMLGRQIKNISQGNEDLLNRLKQILISRLDGFSNEEIDSMYSVREGKDEKVERFKLVSDLKFEAIVANPPFSAQWSANPLHLTDERFSHEAFSQIACLSSDLDKMTKGFELFKNLIYQRYYIFSAFSE